MYVQCEMDPGKKGVLESNRDHRRQQRTSRLRTRQHNVKPRSLSHSNVYDSFWHFAAERQRVFHGRMNKTVPLTDDPILNKFSFTNAYRASDRASQYLIREVLYAGDQEPVEIAFRCILFRMFNRIDTWRLLCSRIGDLTARDFSPARYDRVLEDAMRIGARVYSSAYIMPSGTSSFGFDRKHQNHLALIRMMLRDRFVDRLLDCVSLESVYRLLLSYPMLGPFLAFQLAIDLNYSTVLNFSEMDFIVAGPGARSGIRKCFSSREGWTDEALIRHVAENQENEFSERGLTFESLWGRPLQLIDVQNLFCEIDKYARVAHPDVVGHGQRTRIKRLYRPSSERIAFWYPPKWAINDLIEHSCVAA